MNHDALAEYCENHLEETLEILRELIAINSFTANGPGVNRQGEKTAEAFARLGFDATFVPATRADYGRHLVLKRSYVVGAPTVALVSHLDTVFTEEEEARNNFHWRREGSRIYGPGTNDIKGGTALIHLVLSALRAAEPVRFAAVNWVVLLNACEEVISTDFRAVCREHLPPETLACLIFEGDGGEGDEFSLVAARKGRATFQVHVEGRGAHAGSSHHRGANAVVQLAEVIGKMAGLTNYEDRVTVNIGSAHGGTVANRVPHVAMAELEMRAFSAEVYDRVKQAILTCGGTGSVRSADEDQHACEVTVTIDEETQPWPRNLGTDRLIALWKETGERLGMRVVEEERGGLSDGNLLWDLFPTVDGLGPRGDNCHCSEQSADGRKQQEWVDVSSFVPKAVLNARAILELLQSAAGESRR